MPRGNNNKKKKRQKQKRKDNKVNVVFTIKDNETGEGMTFKMSKFDMMSKAFNTYAEREGVDVSTFHFLLDGERIQETDTPLTLELENDDQIVAVRNDIDNELTELDDSRIGIIIKHEEGEFLLFIGSEIL